MPKLRPRQQLCQICGASAVGTNYGVKSCNACAIFFFKSVGKGRNYNCNAGNKCVVTEKNRKECCKGCRFQKSLTMGMKVELVKQYKKNKPKYVAPAPMVPAPVAPVPVIPAPSSALSTPTNPSLTQTIQLPVPPIPPVQASPIPPPANLAQHQISIIKTENPITPPVPPFLISASFMTKVEESLPKKYHFSWLLLDFCGKPSGLEFVMGVASENLKAKEFTHFSKASWIPLHILDIAKATITEEIFPEYLLKNGEIVSAADIALLGCSENPSKWKELLRVLQCIPDIHESQKIYAILHVMIYCANEPEKLEKVVDFIGAEGFALHAGDMLSVVRIIEGLADTVKEHLTQEKRNGTLEFLKDGKSTKILYNLIGN